MSIKSLTVGELEVNCYFIIDDDTGKTLVVDPGAEPERILSELKRYSLKIAGIINTHGHGDHIAGNSYIKSQSGNNSPVHIHQKDAPMLTDSKKNLSEGLYFQNIVSPAADVMIKDGDVITLGDKIKLEVMHTPGHTPGGICLLLKKPQNKILFSGDTLFYQGVGRTDFPGADEGQLIKSIKEKLFKLPADTVIYPGHGASSTIGQEKKNNPFLS